MRDQPMLGPLITAGVFLGIGLGGFVDGIVLHQIFQWHHMLSSQLADLGFPRNSVDYLQINTFWDGLFHVATWAMTGLGLGLLWRAGVRRDVEWSGRALLGAMAISWGGFNLVEGLIDHQILGLHHVNETVPQGQWIYWDLGFLAFGAILVLGGWALIQAARRTPAVGARVGTEAPGRQAA